MSLPTTTTTTTTIITVVLAIYGAILSTLTAIVQVINHLRDRAKVQLKVRKNMKSPNMGRRYDGMTMVIISATNIGRRPITMTGFAMRPLTKKGETVLDYYLHDVRPPTPCEITEGKYVAAFVNQETLNFDKVGCWYAWDSTGREYYLHVAPWYKRLLSWWRRRQNNQVENKPL
jgi:hypothetical protein